MRKGKIACFKQFLLFSQCFPQLYVFSASNAALFSNGLTLSKQSLVLTTLEMNPFENFVGKGENAGNQHFLLFIQCFLLLSNTYFKFSVKFILLSANSFNLDSEVTALSKHFLLSYHVFSTLSKNIISLPVHVYGYRICHPQSFRLEESKISCTTPVRPFLTLSQTTNFRFFQIERLCRRQFQI